MLLVGLALLLRAALIPSLAQTPTYTWTSAPASPIKRYESPGAVVNNKLYVFGGFDDLNSACLCATKRVDYYDPATTTWTRVADMPVPISHINTAVDGQNVWIAGGFQGNDPGVATANVWKYDVAANSWTPGPSLPEPRAGGALVRLNRELHYISGVKADRKTDAADHWVLNLDGGAGWSSAAPLPNGRNHLSGAAVDNKIYAIGGQDGHDVNPIDTNQVDVYDAATNTWTAAAPLPTLRSHFEPGTFVRNGRILIFGGKSGDVPFVADGTEYNPATNTWTSVTPLPEALRAPVVQPLGNRLMMVGGGHTNGYTPQATAYLATLGNPGQTAAAHFAIDPPEKHINASTYGSGSFRLRNTSAGGEQIRRVRIDLASSILPDMIFDPYGTGGDPVGKDFTPDSGQSTTGLAGHRFLREHGGGYDVLEITFNEFDAGEEFTFSIDNDPASVKGTTINDGPNYSPSVSGLELTGATVTVEYSDGSVQVGEPYRIANSVSGAQTTIKAGTPSAPSLAALGVAATPAKVARANQTVRVSGPAGAAVAMLVVEGGLYTAGVPGGGYELSPYDANKAVRVSEHTATIGGGGYVDVPVVLTRSDAESGLNYIRAVIKEGDGRTGLTSATLILEYDPNYVAGGGQTPYAGASSVVPGVIQAEDFDQGGEGTAYHDVDAANNGGQYRQSGVDIEATTDGGGGYNVGWSNAGEWLEYTVNVQTSGTYRMEARVASAVGGGGLHIEMEGANKTGTMPVANTGGWQAWQTVTKGGISLAAGEQVMRVVMESGDINLNHIRIVSEAGTPPPTPPPTPTPTPMPTPVTSAFLEQSGQVVIEAESYHNMISRSGKSWTARSDRPGYVGSGAMVAEPKTATNINTGYATTSPELQYRVQFNTPGTYYVWLRTLANDTSDNSVHVGIDGQEVASADRLSMNSYGAWTWTQSTVDGPVATLVVTTAGEHTINVWMREDGYRFDRLLLTTLSTTPSGTGPAESPRAGGTPTNAAPTVDITAPANGGTFTAPANITINANAADGDGTVSKVEFYSGTTLLGTDATAPYSYAWTNVAAGSYTLTAKATDNAGAATVSAAVNTTVTSGGSTPTQTPYSGSPFPAPGMIQAEDFDKGGEAVAYHDTDGGNLVGPSATTPGGYRPTEGVDIESTTDAGGGYNIGYIYAGEWLEYTLNVATAGTYTVETRVAAQGIGGTFHIEVNGADKTGPLTIPNTSGWQSWQTVSKSGVSLSAGQQVLRIMFDKTGPNGFIGNLNYIRIVADTTNPQDPDAPGALPTPWMKGDIGSVGLAGSAAYTNGGFTLSGSGADIWGTADAFHYVYQPLTGDGQIIARVSNVQNTDAWAKAGVMIRETLTAGSPHASMFVTANSGIAFQRRVSGNGASTHTSAGDESAPQWVKLVRSGNTITGYKSMDGVTWVLAGSDTILMSSSVYVGLAVTAHNNAVLSTATLDNVTVSVSGATPPTPTPTPTPTPAPTPSGRAYNSTPATVPGTIQAENFDNGGEAVAYHDQEAANQSGQYRLTEGVDIESTTDAGGGYNIGYIYAGEWLEYTVNVATAGTYTLETRVAAQGIGGTFHIEVGGADKTGPLTIPNTGGWQSWQTVPKSGVSLSAGQQVVRVVFDTAGAAGFVGNLNYIKFIDSSSSIGSSSNISFKTKTIIKKNTTAGSAYGISDFENPTSLDLGPDGKLFVATQYGKLYIITLDPAKLTQPDQVAVINSQTLTDIANKKTRTCNIGGNLNNCQQLVGSPTGRQVTALVVGPESTSERVALYVSHSDPRIGKGDPTALTIDTYSGVVTRLILVPNTATANQHDYSVQSNQDLIVGLPRSRENHSVNGIDFGPDGWLYISLPGHTNYGQPSAFFSDLPEYYLSAAVARLNVAALGSTAAPLNMEGVKSATDMTAYKNMFELYATGFRNGYDLVWHSNGKLYLNDNSGNDGLGTTPDASDGCTTPALKPGALGTLPDELHLVTAGSYGGHPNPARKQCVMNNGTVYDPDQQPEAGYREPLLLYNNGASTNGIVEYKSDAFGGKLKGNLISATYAGNQNVRRVVLNSTGTGVTQEENMGTYGMPLDVTTDQNGLIYVAEFGTNQSPDQIIVMIPNYIATCPDASRVDDDEDGYSDTDEAAHGTLPCSPADKPADFDADKLGDLTDPDDDDDGLVDAQDQLFFDGTNGASTPLPLRFEWNPGDAPLSKVANTGFTGTQVTATGGRTNTAGIYVGAAGGFMAVPTASNTAEETATNVVKTLQLGFDSSQGFSVASRIVNPLKGVPPASGHVGGIYFGSGENDFVRAAIVGVAGGTQALQLGLKVGGSFNEQSRIDLGTAAITNLDLYLIGDPAAKTVTAYYDLEASGKLMPVGVPVSVPATWFSTNTGATRNSSLTGLMVSHGGAKPTSFVYDFFRINRNISTP